MVDAAYEAVRFDEHWAVNGPRDFRKAVRAMVLAAMAGSSRPNPHGGAKAGCDIFDSLEVRISGSDTICVDRMFRIDSPFVSCKISVILSFCVASRTFGVATRWNNGSCSTLGKVTTEIYAEIRRLDLESVQATEVNRSLRLAGPKFRRPRKAVDDVRAIVVCAAE